MRNLSSCFLISFVVTLTIPAFSGVTVDTGPDAIPCFGVYELTVRLDPPPGGNPFTDVEINTVFTPKNGSPIRVDGFCDDQSGRIFRIRFSPALAETEYTYSVTSSLSPGWKYKGSFRTTASAAMEPVIADPERPKHFRYSLSRKPFYHLGITAYHLLDPTNDDRHIEEFIDYSVRNGFNKIRFLLTGYPRDTDTRSSDDYEYGVGDQWKMPNYGAPPGQVNPLPAWLGDPHHYEFTRFNVAYWQKVDRAVRAMRERGVVATCIVTIEKQNLPKEYGTLTEHEKRLYRYAVARLAAFSNVWWDLGNEHNEFRKPDWTPKMGDLVKEWDPYNRPCSAHGYAEWLYDDQPWADYIITQQYGNCAEVNQWVLKYKDIPKPYVNEEYGYEGKLDKPGHGHNTDWVRRCHWSIALAGGYATYGDWTPGTHFYTGHIGQGKAPAQLRVLREIFESLPFSEMQPHNGLVANGAFCLAKLGEVYLVYLPNGGETLLNLKHKVQECTVTWINPRTGKRENPQKTAGTKIPLRAPSLEDWAVLIAVNP